MQVKNLPIKIILMMFYILDYVCIIYQMRNLKSLWMIFTEYLSQMEYFSLTKEQAEEKCAYTEENVTSKVIQLAT